METYNNKNNDLTSLSAQVYSLFKEYMSESDEQLDSSFHTRLFSLINGQNSPVSKPQEEEQIELPFNNSNSASGLSQIVTWPGGKKKELNLILSHVPSYDRYFEPFCGGGSVFMGINANEYYINDFCSDLMYLYGHISTSDSKFFGYLEKIDSSMLKAGLFFNGIQNDLLKIFNDFKENILDENDMKTAVSDWCRQNQFCINHILSDFKSKRASVLSKEMEKYLVRRLKSLKKIEACETDKILTSLEVAIKGGLYLTLRHMFNDPEIKNKNNQLYSALFFYIRQNVFGAKFSYNKKGEFNESYGGSSQLKNRLINKLNYFRSEEVQEHFKRAQLYNLDFEDFLIKSSPKKNDFIFLDPPYDCNFTEYDQNEFTQIDHKRLTHYLLNTCESKWMMIINNTKFIYDLYNQEGIHIHEYDMKYQVNMKNNNNQGAKHLLITNYPLAENEKIEVIFKGKVKSKKVA